MNNSVDPRRQMRSHSMLGMTSLQVFFHLYRSKKSSGLNEVENLRDLRATKDNIPVHISER